MTIKQRTAVCTCLIPLLALVSLCFWAVPAAWGAQAKDAAVSTASRAEVATAAAPKVAADAVECDAKATAQKATCDARVAARASAQTTKTAIAQAKAVDMASALHLEKASAAASPAVVSATQKSAAVQAAATAQAEGSLKNKGIYTLAPRVKGSARVEVANGALEDGAVVHIYTENCTTAQRWRATSLGGGYYRFVNVGTGKALGVAGGVARKGASVRQYAKDGSAAQSWRVESFDAKSCRLRSALSDNLALTLKGTSKANGTRLVLGRVDGRHRQLWNCVQITPALPDGCYALENEGTGRALDVSNASFADGANVQQWTSNGTLAQTFHLSYKPKTGYYAITSTNSCKVLDVENGSWSAGANVQQWAANDSLAQRWAITPAKNGGFTIRSALGGHALEVEYASMENGANVRMWDANGTDAQRWMATAVTPRPQEDGCFIMSFLNPANVLSISYDGTSVVSHENVGSDHQRWNIIEKKGMFAIENATTGTYLSFKKASAGANVRMSSTKRYWIIAFTPRGFKISPVGRTDLAIGIAKNSPKSGANMKLVAACNKLGQKFGFQTLPSSPEEIEQFERITYEYLGITIHQMAQWQCEGNEYLDVGWEQLLEALSAHDTTSNQFMDLRVYTGMTAAQIDANIDYYEKGRNGTLHGLGAAFVEAAQTYGVNEVYLLAHAITESGWGTSTLASGYSEGGKTYYNFFGIGANDSSPTAGGRRLAVENDWSSPAKAVLGGAKWIAEHYTYREDFAQPTIYAMKWDYRCSNVWGTYGNHQYATSADWPVTMASFINTLYERAGCDKSLQRFIVPVYK